MHNHRSGATKAGTSAAALLVTIVLSAFAATAALGQCPASPPTQGGALPGPNEPPLTITRTYSPVHNVGHFRYIECSHRTEDGRPDGDIAVWDEVRFPFDPALQDATELSLLSVSHSPNAEAEIIEEKYSCDSSGAVEVQVSNQSSGYSRKYRLGRWSQKAAPIVPGRKRKARVEGR